jgi:phosphoribosylanthranilate isomerase
MKVIARNITNLTDARYFAAKEVGYLVFNLEEGASGYLDPSHMQAMREWVQGPLITGEFGDTAHVDTVNESVRFFGLDAVIVPAPLRAMQVDCNEVIVRLQWNGQAPDVSGMDEGITAYLLDLSGSVPTDWSQVADWAKTHLHKPLFVQFNGQVSELNAVRDVLKPYGISLTGGEEEAVGVKSFDEIEAIFDFLEADPYS